MTLPTADLAYAAAIIDNLATLRVREYRDSTLPVVEVSGRYGALPWLGQLTGVRVIPTNRSYQRHGCAEHCPDRHLHIESTSCRWSVTGMRATIVLAAVEPHLRMQAVDARLLIDAGLRVQYQSQVVVDMRERGWPIPELPEHTHPRVKLKESA